MAFTNDKMTPVLKRIASQLNKLPQKAFNVFKDNTPVASGNAQRKTQLVGSEIRANYPYASRLDNGYSRKRPQGMTRPTEVFIQDELNRIMRK